LRALRGERLNMNLGMPKGAPDIFEPAGPDVVRCKVCGAVVMAGWGQRSHLRAKRHKAALRLAQ
jgi:hypothetical protein